MVVREPHTQIMQQTHANNAVNECVKAKKLLSGQKQSDYSAVAEWLIVGDYKYF